MNCAYCGNARAVVSDHVIPRVLQKKLTKQGKDIGKLAETVPACFKCNHLKSTRKLIPASWEKYIPALQEIAPGPWRTWNGDPSSPVFTEVHK